MTFAIPAFKKILLGTATVALSLIPYYSAQALGKVAIVGFGPFNELDSFLENQGYEVLSFESDFPTDYSELIALIIQKETGFSSEEEAIFWLSQQAPSLNASFAGGLSTSTNNLPPNLLIADVVAHNQEVSRLGTLITNGSLSPNAEGNETQIITYNLGDDFHAGSSNLLVQQNLVNFLTPTNEPPSSIPEPATVLSLLIFGSAGLLLSRPN
jgi:hypothetical protein